MIKAYCGLDDFSMQLDFDAEPWFKKANDTELKELYDSGFAGNHPADMVVVTSADWDEEVSEFMYLWRNCSEASFNCIIDRDQAMAWLKENRPELIRTT